MNETARNKVIDLFGPKYREVGLQLLNLFKDKITVDSCFKMIDFPEIALLYMKTTGEKFIKFADAYNNCPADSSIVYFSFIDLYCVVTASVFRDLVEKCRDKQYKGIPLGDLKLYKIVVASENQKPVFIFNASAQIDKLKDYAKKHFKGAEVVFSNDGTSTQIVLTGINSASEEDTRKIFKEFCDFIGKQDAEMAKNLQIQQPENIDSIPSLKLFLQTKVDEDILYDYDDLFKLGQIKHLTINIIQNQINGDHNVQNVADKINNYHGDVNKITNQIIKPISRSARNAEKSHAERYPGAAKWIIANPPEYNETTTEYHKRYVQSVKPSISNKLFGPVVTEIYGDETFWTRSGRVWRLGEH